MTAYSPLGSPGRDTKSEAEPYLLGDAAIVRLVACVMGNYVLLILDDRNIYSIASELSIAD